MNIVCSGCNFSNLYTHFSAEGYNNFTESIEPQSLR